MILLTGGAGYIGAVTLRHLLNRGQQVIVLDDLSRGSSKNVPSQVPFFKADIANKVMLAEIFSKYPIEEIIHFAAYTSVEESVRNPLMYYENNFSKSVILLEECVRAGVKRFLFSSTAAVYGEPQSEQVREQDQLKPLNPYGMSKLFFEEALRDTARANSNFKVLCLRYFNVCGASLDLSVGPLNKNSPQLFRMAAQASILSDRRMQIYGSDFPTPDGSAIRDFIHVEDLAHAHVLALEKMRLGLRCEVMNLGNGRGYSVREVVNEFQRMSEKGFEVDQLSPRPGDPIRVLADSTLARNELGWEARIKDLGAMVESSYLWEKKLLSGSF